MRLGRNRHQGGFCPSAPPIQNPSVARKPLRRLARCEGGLLTPIGRLTARPITRFPIASQQQILSPLVLWPFRKHQAISGSDLDSPVYSLASQEAANKFMEKEQVH